MKTANYFPLLPNLIEHKKKTRISRIRYLYNSIPETSINPDKKHKTG